VLCGLVAAAVGWAGERPEAGEAREAAPPTRTGPGREAAPPARTEAQRPRLEPEADRVLRGMSNYLVHLPAFGFRSETIDEVVLESGQKLQFPAESRVLVERPNKVRSDRLSAPQDVSLLYDGSRLSLFGRASNAYATAKAPPAIDQMIDFVRGELHLDAPAADLLYSDPYAVLTEDVVSGRHVGQVELDGVLVDHLAFEGHETDWELWVEAGPRPLPRRLVITSKKMTSSPQFTVRLDQWDVSPRVAPEMFSFQPPKGAAQVDFDELWKRTGGPQPGMAVSQREEGSGS
jgi:hypothetical protein